MSVFKYVSDGYEYILKPVFYVNGTRRIRVKGAELYGAGNNKYYGYWPRHNMPMNLVYQLEMRCRWLYAHQEYIKDDDGNMRDNEEPDHLPIK